MLGIAWLLHIYLSILKVDPVSFSLGTLYMYSCILTVFLLMNCHITLWFVLLSLGQEGESVSIMSDVVKQGSVKFKLVYLFSLFF